jgi:hypothetical protein
MKKLGVNPPMQILWRMEHRLNPGALADMHSRISVGPLNSRMLGAQFPLARPVWTPHEQGTALTISESEIDVSGLLDWADAACRVPLDAHGGRGWSLSATNLSDGTAAVSLTCSHALTDGQGAVSAMVLATNRVPYSAPAIGPTVTADIVDALTGGARAFGRLTAARAIHRITAFAPDLASLNSKRPTAAPVRGRLAVSVHTDRLHDAAAAAGGNTTSLLLSMAANVLRTARGSDRPERPFSVAIPMSFRRPGDLLSSNMVGMATVSLKYQASRYTDLAMIRDLSRTAFKRVKYGQHLTGYPRSDAALSNLGSMPLATRDAFGPATMVLFRTVSGSADGEGRLNCFALESGDIVSLAFQSSGVQVERDIVGAELNAWGIDVLSWW